MGIGVSLLLVAVGAILTWAVTADVSGVDIQTVGVILMVVGIVGAHPLARVLVELGRLRDVPPRDGRSRPRPRRRALGRATGRDCRGRRGRRPRHDV